LAGHGRILVILAGRLHGRILTQNRNRIPDYRGGLVCSLELEHPGSILPRVASKWVFLGSPQASPSEADEKEGVSDCETSYGRDLFLLGHARVHDPIHVPSLAHDRVPLLL
jgi:hypothetical protein